jgi:hypothetical protein
VTDTITGKQATSLGSPQFVPDRNGMANGAILINSDSSSWQLPVDAYFQGDTTVTMWVKGNENCSSMLSRSSVFCNYNFFVSYCIIPKLLKLTFL